MAPRTTCCSSSTAHRPQRRGFRSAKRDNPPALSTDVFLGYEQTGFVQRNQPEKFAAVEQTRNKFSSAGAETYAKVIGTPGFTITPASENTNHAESYGGDAAEFLEHDRRHGGRHSGRRLAGRSRAFAIHRERQHHFPQAKPNSVGGGFRMFCYFTTDSSNPEGAAGNGAGTTQVAEMNFSHNEGRRLVDERHHSQARLRDLQIQDRHLQGRLAIMVPGNSAAVERIGGMVSEFEIDGFNADTVEYFPHNDYARVQDPNLPYGDWDWATRNRTGGRIPRASRPCLHQACRQPESASGRRADLQHLCPDLLLRRRAPHG